MNRRFPDLCRRIRQNASRVPDADFPIASEQILWHEKGARGIIRRNI